MAPYWRRVDAKVHMGLRGRVFEEARPSHAVGAVLGISVRDMEYGLAGILEILAMREIEIRASLGISGRNKEYGLAGILGILGMREIEI